MSIFTMMIIQRCGKSKGIDRPGFDNPEHSDLTVWNPLELHLEMC